MFNKEMIVVGSTYCNMVNGKNKRRTFYSNGSTGCAD